MSKLPKKGHKRSSTDSNTLMTEPLCVEQLSVAQPRELAFLADGPLFHIDPYPVQQTIDPYPVKFVLLRTNPSENNDNNVASQRNLVAPVSYSLEAPVTMKQRKKRGWRWSRG